MAYKWIKTNVSVRRLADNADIPNDPLNEQWREYQAWVDGGGVTLPESPFQPSNDFDGFDRVFKAKCLSDLAFRLGKPPGALTLAEIQAERNRIKNIAEAL